MPNDIILVSQPITKEKLKEIANQRFGDMVKAVVDTEKEIMALGADLHADEESYLLEQNSKQPNLWGINLYPDLDAPDFIEFDSMINVRPHQNNRSRDIEDPQIRTKIELVVKKLIISQ